MEWRGKTKSTIWRRDQKEPVNYYREPEFLWVRHVTEETDSGKAAAVVYSTARKWKEWKSGEGGGTERGRVRDNERETGPNFYQISLWALCGGQQRKMNCTIWQLALPQRPEIPSTEKNIMIPPGSTDSCTSRHRYSTVYTLHKDTHTHTHTKTEMNTVVIRKIPH